MTSSSSNSSMQTSSASSTLNNLLPTPTNLSNLLPEIDKDKELDSEEDATTSPSPSVGAAKITLNFPTDVVVSPPQTLIDKPLSTRGDSNSPCWSFFKLFNPSCHPELEKYVQCMLCHVKITRGKDSSTGWNEQASHVQTC